MSEELDGLFETLENDLLSKYEYNLLLNYITNLQKENEELKDTIKKDNHLLGCNFSKKDKYKQERDIYKQRNEKAIDELFELKNMIYKPETREENFEIQRKISSIIKKLGLAGDE